jgi:hypothetical protein
LKKDEWLRQFISLSPKDKRNSATCPPVSGKRKGRGKGDDMSLDFYLRGSRSGNYKGRKKGWDHGILKEAWAIVYDEKLEEWKDELGISELEYFRLRYLMIDYEWRKNAFGRQVPTNIPRRYTPEAIKKMAKELGVLMVAMSLFMIEIEKAKKEGNVTFLKTVRKVFRGEDKDFGLTDFKKGRGDDIKQKTISKAYRLFTEWLNEDRASLPSTFWQRDKPKGLCVLAFKIHMIFTRKQKAQLKRLQVINKMRLLAEKYGVSSDEVFPPKQTKKTGERNFVSLVTRLSEVDKLLEELKDI